MRKLLAAAILLGVTFTPATGQSVSGGAARVQKVITVCEALAADWRSLEQNMADRFVEGHADTDATRATMREMREANDLALASLTVQFMRDNHCPLPKRALRSETYLNNALECSKARRERPAATGLPACERANWKAQ